MLNKWRNLLLAAESKEPKYLLLADAITSDINEGLLEPGQKLPTHRDLARDLDVSVQTISNSYREIERRGLIDGQLGRGTFVIGVFADNTSQYMLDTPDSNLIDLSTVRITHGPLHNQIFRELCNEISLSPTQPWVQNCRPVAGIDTHREAGAAWLKELGIDVSYDRLLICNGASQGIFIALMAIVQPGDLVVSDSLTDHGIIGVSKLLGCGLMGLHADRYGIIPESFEEICRSHDVKVLFITPNLNNPTVTLMTEQRRQEIAEIALRNNVYVIEDDVYGPLLTKRNSPICEYVPETGFYCTSLTKSILTGLRIGYLVVPDKLYLRVESILRLNSWMVSTFLSEVATRLLTNGDTEKLIKYQRKLLKVRQALVQRILGDYVIGNHSDALSAWLSVPEYWKVDDVVSEIKRLNVAVTSPDPFMTPNSEKPHALRVCISGEFNENQLTQALIAITKIFNRHPAI